MLLELPDDQKASVAAEIALGRGLRMRKVRPVAKRIGSERRKHIVRVVVGKHRRRGRNVVKIIRIAENELAGLDYVMAVPVRDPLARSPDDRLRDTVGEAERLRDQSFAFPQFLRGLLL